MKSNQTQHAAARSSAPETQADVQSIANDVTRRDFLRGGSLAALLTAAGASQIIAPRKAAAVDVDKVIAFQVKTGVIGMGAWGKEVVNTLSRQKEAIVAGVCDTFPAALRKAKAAAPDAKEIGRAHV